MIEKYREFYDKRANEAEQNKEKWDCNDFQTRIISEFARDNGLPLHFNTRNGTIIDIEDYDSFDSFWNAVSRSLSASNLDLLTNTEMVRYEDRKSGDLRLIEFSNSMHVVGYLKNNNKIVYGDYSYSKGQSLPIKITPNWTKNTVSYPSVVDLFENRKVYGPEYVLRWNFGQFNKGSK